MVSSLSVHFAAILSLFSFADGTPPAAASLLSNVEQSPQITNEFTGDGDSYWVSLSRFDPMKNAAYGTLTIKKSFYMKMDVTWHGLTREAADRDFEGILRIGSRSSAIRDCSGHATRFPALYLDRTRRAIQFSLSNDIDCWGVGLLNVSLPDLERDTVYTLVVAYNASWVHIEANDLVLFDGERLGSTPDAMLYSTASVLLSDGLDPPADVTLSNIVIMAYDDTLSLPPTPTPSLAPSRAPSRSPTPRPTPKPTPHPIVTTLHPTPSPTEEADFFATKIKIYAEYEVAAAEKTKMNLVDEAAVGAIAVDVFPPWNVTMRAVTVDAHHSSINLDFTVSVATPGELAILDSFLAEEMAPRLTASLEAAYPWVTVSEVHHSAMVHAIRLSSDESGGAGIGWLPFAGDASLWIIVGAVAVCCCSTVFAVCTLWYICKLRRRHKTRRECQRDGVIFGAESKLSASSNLTSSANSKSGDGYGDDHEMTGHRPQREEVQLMMTDGSFVRKKRGHKKKRTPIQYQRIHSHLGDDGGDGGDGGHGAEDDEALIDGAEAAAAPRFLTPWGPMTGGIALGDDSEDGVDGADPEAVTGGGSGWEFEYDFNVDTFPFHLLGTLSAMTEAESTPLDGAVTGGPRRKRSTLDIVVEDRAEPVRLVRSRKRRTKAAPKRRTTTASSLECGVEESVVANDSETESNLAEKSGSGGTSSAEEMYDEGFGRRDTMPSQSQPLGPMADTMPGPMAPPSVQSNLSLNTIDSTEANYLGGSHRGTNSLSSTR